jgi:signal transduction histidine kinase
VAQLIEETYKLYRGSYPEITFSLTEKAPSTIFTDDHKIKQALINLIDNSIRAMNIAGTPKKEIVITLDTNAQNGCLQLAYSDNGPGIPAPLQDTLFLPYVSSDKKNLGLGLAIVHQIFKQLGGSIALNNSKQGAFFLCHLPQNNNA